MVGQKKAGYLVTAAAIFIGLPLLLWSMGNAPMRTILKEAISVGSLLVFSLMLGLLFLTGRNSNAVQHLTKRSTVRIHKWIGYFGAGLLLCHPILLVVPRHFESGVDPVEAFTKMVSTFDNRGVALGILAWCLLLILVFTSLFRDRLPLKYKTWRVFHGSLAIVLIPLGAWHAMELGRHVGPAVSIYLAVLSGSGVVLLVHAYHPKPSFKGG